MILNGPVPAGALANSAHDPAFSNCAGLDIEHVGQHVREVAERPRRADLDRVIVDLAVAGEEGVARLRHRRAGRVELRRVLLEVAVEVPDRRIGVEIAAVVELHAAGAGGRSTSSCRSCPAPSFPPGPGGYRRACRRGSGPTARGPRTPGSRESARPHSRCPARRSSSARRTRSSRSATFRPPVLIPPRAPASAQPPLACRPASSWSTSFAISVYLAPGPRREPAVGRGSWRRSNSRTTARRSGCGRPLQLSYHRHPSLGTTP